MPSPKQHVKQIDPLERREPTTASQASAACNQRLCQSPDTCLSPTSGSFLRHSRLAFQQGLNVSSNFAMQPIASFRAGT